MASATAAAGNVATRADMTSRTLVAVSTSGW
jgi:hypothetical protein